MKTQTVIAWYWWYLTVVSVKRDYSTCQPDNNRSCCQESSLVFFGNFDIFNYFYLSTYKKYKNVAKLSKMNYVDFLVSTYQHWKCILNSLNFF